MSSEVKNGFYSGDGGVEEVDTSAGSVGVGTVILTGITKRTGFAHNSPAELRRGLTTKQEPDRGTKNQGKNNKYYKFGGLAFHMNSIIQQ